MLAAAASIVASLGVQVAASRPLAASSVTVAVPGCVVDESDIVGWWRGGNLDAQVGRRLRGHTDIGRGIIGDAFALDTATVLSASGIAAPSDGLTVDAWVKPRDGHRVQSIISRWDVASSDPARHSFNLMLAWDILIWVVETSDGPRAVVVDADRLFDGSFHHVAGTWSPNGLALYVDGERVASAEDTSGVSVEPAAATDVRLGAVAGRPNPMLRFVGLLDEASVIGRALSADEVQQLVWAGPNGKCTDGSAGSGGPDTNDRDEPQRGGSGSDDGDRQRR